MDFAEFFTHGARAIVPLAWKKGLLFLFDVRGPSVSVECDARAMHESLARLSASALDLLDEGFVFASAQTEMRDDDTADVSVSIAGTGHRIDDARVDAVLRRLALKERAPPPGVPAHEAPRIALGTCPATGATLTFVSNRTDGVLFAFDLNVPARLMEPSGPPPHAHGARAWLIAEAPLTYQSLMRRLQRLGWATRTFPSVQAAVDQLARTEAGTACPRLVVAAESAHVTAGQMRALRELVPRETQVVLAAALDTRTRTAASRIELRHWPLSPRELDEFTRHAGAGDGDPYSGDTSPAPLAFADRPAALVVDDNAVNLLVASGLLQIAGYEVDTATGGAEAIAHCREHPPQLVLMDVHMPHMDGLETTRQLRELQSRGVMPRFPILAATADPAEIGEVVCRDAGMDGYLSKPLSLQAIRRELQRLAAAAPH
jgi:CheY-like chemotaxis protein